MTTTTLITVAPTGAESAKADVPALPVTLDELVATAKECEAVGASVIHVHIRDDEARPTLDPGRLRDTVAGAARVDRPDRPALLGRRGHRPGGRPAGRARRRPRDGLLHDGHGQLRRRRVPQPVGVHRRPAHPDAGARHRARVRDLRPRPPDRAGAAARPARAAGRRARARRLRHGRARRHARHRPTRWSPARRRCATCPTAPRSRPPASAGPRCRCCSPRSSAGGHLRVGMEDTVTYAKGQPVESNAQLVARAAAFARLAQRPPLTPGEARAHARRAGPPVSAVRAAACRSPRWSGPASSRAATTARSRCSTRPARLVGRAGDPYGPIFPRSSNKPMQAVGDAAGRAGAWPTRPTSRWSRRATTASRSHVDRVRAMLRRGRPDRGSQLRLPAGPAAVGVGPRRRAARPAAGRRAVLMNCSGKHTGMLLTCRAAGWSDRGLSGRRTTRCSGPAVPRSRSSPASRSPRSAWTAAAPRCWRCR